jgi:hypothetical protein
VRRAQAQEIAEPGEELGLEGSDGDVAAVGCLVDAVAGEPAGQQLRNRLARESVRRKAVRAVSHRDDDMRAPACLLALDQGGEDLGHRPERSGGKISDLNGRQGGSGVGEDAGPAEVVEVVSGPQLVPPSEPEAGDRAVDDSLGEVCGPDAEPCGDARAEALDDHVGLRAQRPPPFGLELQVARHRLLAGVEGFVPARGEVAHRVASGRLEADDPRSELE